VHYALQGPLAAGFYYLLEVSTWGGFLGYLYVENPFTLYSPEQSYNNLMRARFIIIIILFILFLFFNFVKYVKWQSSTRGRSQI
jgi:hypothetical protein